MRPVLIFGASRGVGLALARLLRDQNVPVTTVQRSPVASDELEEIGAHIVCGDAFSRDDVACAFANSHGGCDVVSTLGGRAPDGRYVDDEG
ncbi:MAG: NAD(P)H-binding protein, partial [Parvibaculum sp.]|nr:NAD(P)H-binding protein [Parvibaculum sp.]